MHEEPTKDEKPGASDPCPASAGDSRCGFCDGPMPCYCPDPLAATERDRWHLEDAEMRNMADGRQP